MNDFSVNLEHAVNLEHDHGQEIDLKMSKSTNLVVPKNILEHQDQINALMIAIKPSLYEYYFKRFTPDMIKRFFLDVRNEFQVPDK